MTQIFWYYSFRSDTKRKKEERERETESPLKPWLGFSTSHSTLCLDPTLVPDSPRGRAGTQRNEQPSLGPQREVLHPFGTLL